MVFRFEYGNVIVNFSKLVRNGIMIVYFLSVCIVNENRSGDCFFKIFLLGMEKIVICKEDIYGI